MLPLFPPYVIAEFAHLRGEGRFPDGRPRRQADPEGFLDLAALYPAPVVTERRQRSARSPIALLMRLFDRRNDAGRTTAAS